MEMHTYTSDGYRTFLTEHRLAGTRCANCGAVYLPPRPLCRECGGGEMVWVEFEGGGVVETFSVIYFPPAELLAAGYGRQNPGCTAIVRMDEGPAIAAQIVGPDLVTTPDVAVGDRVRAGFVERGDEPQTYLVFVKE